MNHEYNQRMQIRLDKNRKIIFGDFSDIQETSEQIFINKCKIFLNKLEQNGDIILKIDNEYHYIRNDGLIRLH